MSKSAISPSPDTSSVIAAVPGLLRVKERRNHKRYASPLLKVTFLGAEHETLNWSLGGVLVADSHPHTPVGATADGFLDILGHPGRFALRLELVRRDKRTKEIAFRFIEPSAALLNALSRTMAEQTSNPETKRIMLHLAATYEQISNRVSAPNDNDTSWAAVSAIPDSGEARK